MLRSRRLSVPAAARQREFRAEPRHAHVNRLVAASAVWCTTTVATVMALIRSCIAAPRAIAEHDVAILRGRLAAIENIVGDAANVQRITIPVPLHRDETGTLLSLALGANVGYYNRGVMEIIGTLWSLNLKAAWITTCVLHF